MNGSNPFPTQITVEPQRPASESGPYNYKFKDAIAAKMMPKISDYGMMVADLIVSIFGKAWSM